MVLVRKRISTQGANGLVGQQGRVGGLRIRLVWVRIPPSPYILLRKVVNMSPKHTIEKIKENIEHTSYDGNVWFKWKTPDKFIYNGKFYSLDEKSRKELREEIGELIKIYINSKECVDGSRRGTLD